MNPSQCHQALDYLVFFTGCSCSWRFGLDLCVRDKEKRVNECDQRCLNNHIFFLMLETKHAPEKLDLLSELL
jgi:hypothetical protein